MLVEAGRKPFVNELFILDGVPAVESSSQEIELDVNSYC